MSWEELDDLEAEESELCVCAWCGGTFRCQEGASSGAVMRAIDRNFDCAHSFDKEPPFRHADHRGSRFGFPWPRDTWWVHHRCIVDAKEWAPIFADIDELFFACSKLSGAINDKRKGRTRKEDYDDWAASYIIGECC